MTDWEVPLELCVLPQTGASDALWPVVVLAAAALIAVGVVLLRSGAARRRVLMGVGALAVAGALAFGTVASAPSAQADAAPTDCITEPVTPAATAAPAPTAAPTPPVTPEPTPPVTPEPTPPVTPEPTEPELIAVAPNAPTAAARCAQEPEIAIPTQEGVTYAQSQVGSILTVAASAQPGYVLATGAPSSWTFDLTPTPVAAMPINLAEYRIQASAPFRLEPASEWRVRVIDETATLFTLLAAASEQGVTTTYGTSDEIVVTYRVYDPLTPTLSRDERVSVPWSSTVAYDAETRELVVTIPDPAALTAAWERAEAELRATGSPLTQVRQISELGLGLTVITSFVPGPGCPAVSQSTPIGYAPLD